MFAHRNVHVSGCLRDGALAGLRYPCAALYIRLCCVRDALFKRCAVYALGCFTRWDVYALCCSSTAVLASGEVSRGTLIIYCAFCAMLSSSRVRFTPCAVHAVCGSRRVLFAPRAVRTVCCLHRLCWRGVLLTPCAVHAVRC